MSVDIVARGLASKALLNSGIPGPKGDSFTYSDLTTEQIQDIRSGVTTFNTIIRGQETKIGIVTLSNLDYDLYRIIVDITDIPTTLNEEATFTLSEIPLGFNLYLKTDSLVVAQEPSTGTTDFYNNSYTISKLFVDSDLSTKIIIKCIKEVTTSVKATIQVEYIKDFGDVLTLDVTVPEGINPADVNLTFPKLKYNKSNVASLTVDDSYSIWNNVFSPINKRWVDDELMSFFNPADDRAFFYHKDCEYNGYSKTTGSYPTKALEYTDGAGIRHRFGASVAAWAWKFGTRDYVAGILWPWVSAIEGRFMQDFGISFNYHDILGVSEYADTHSGSTDVPQTLFNEYVRIDRDSFTSLIDKAPKILQGPNGDPNYIYKARLCPEMQYTMEIANRGTDSECTPFLPFNNTHLLDKKSEKYMVQRSFISEGYNFEAWKNDVLAQASASESTRKWTILGIHRAPNPLEGYGVVNALTDIETAQGITGDDSIWFPSIDELYEYWFITNYGAHYKIVNNQTITFKIYTPCNRNFWFKSISCLLNGISDLTGISVTSSDNCNGTSFAINDGKLLVNLDFNTDLLTKVEKYLTIYENAPSQEYAYDDALYFIQMLKPGVREPYQTRLDLVIPGTTPTATPTPTPVGPTNTPTPTPTATPTATPEPTVIVAVLAFTPTVPNNSITYTTAEGIVGNQIAMFTNPAYGSTQLKSINGELLSDWNYVHDGDYYQIDATHTVEGHNAAAFDGAYLPVLSGNLGPYADVFIGRPHMRYSGSGEFSKGKAMLSLPNGIYTFKFIMSVGVSSGLAIYSEIEQYCKYRVDASGVIGTPVNVGPAGFTGINNVNFNATIENVLVSDGGAVGNVEIAMYTTGGSTTYKPSWNLIEITKTS